MYDVQRGKKKTALELPGALMARSVCVSPVDKDLAFIAADRVVYVWDRRTKASGQSLEGHLARVTDVECASDCNVLWSTSMDGTLRSWDRRRGICLTSLGVRNRSSRAEPIPDDDEIGTRSAHFSMPGQVRDSATGLV